MSDFQERLIKMAPHMFELLREWTEEEVSPRTDLHDRTEAAIRMIIKGPERIMAETFIDAFAARYKP